MSPEKSYQLITIYPDLFNELHNKSCISLFGIECEDGWFELLKDCIAELKEICEKEGINIKANQIKEKYGTLRFYVSEENDAIAKAIMKAEKRSAKTCENCGKEGELKNRGYWLYTQCAECEKRSCN